MIEPITVDGLLKLVQSKIIGESFFKECNLPGHFNEKAWFYNWERLLKGNIGAIWTLKLGDTLAGALGGVLFPDVNDGEMIAMEAFWYVLPQYRSSLWSTRLLTNFEKWAREIGAKRIIMAHLLNSMPDKLHQFYEKRGYKAMEISYVKVL